MNPFFVLKYTDCCNLKLKQTSCVLFFRWILACPQVMVLLIETKTKKCTGTFTVVGDVVASWLVRSPSDRAIRVQAVGGVGGAGAEVTLWWSTILLSGKRRNTTNHFVLLKPEPVTLAWWATLLLYLTLTGLGNFFHFYLKALPHHYPEGAPRKNDAQPL